MFLHFHLTPRVYHGKLAMQDMVILTFIAFNEIQKIRFRSPNTLKPDGLQFNSYTAILIVSHFHETNSTFLHVQPLGVHVAVHSMSDQLLLLVSFTIASSRKTTIFKTKLRSVLLCVSIIFVIIKKHAIDMADSRSTKSQEHIDYLIVASQQQAPGFVLTPHKKKIFQCVMLFCLVKPKTLPRQKYMLVVHAGCKQT